MIYKAGAERGLAVPGIGAGPGRDKRFLVLGLARAGRSGTWHGSCIY